MLTEPRNLAAFFGLRELPFAPTADPAYLFASRDRRECLERIWQGIDLRLGAFVVLGEPGAGKTTLLRKLVAAMRAEPETYRTAVVGAPSPAWSSHTLLAAIAAAFECTPPDPTLTGTLESLTGFLAAQDGRIPTLIVDDAQNLNKRGQLELLRLLHNMETPQHKLLNMVFFAQADWMQALRAAPAFHDRIHTTCTLGPLDEDEVVGLVRFRLAQAGSGGQGPVLEGGALRAIAAFANGNTRAVVTLCHNTLALAAQLQSRHIGQTVVLQAIQGTTPRDPERDARVAAALSLQGPGVEGAEAIVTDPALGASQAVQTNRYRAGRLLKRVAGAPDGAAGNGDDAT